MKKAGVILSVVTVVIVGAGVYFLTQKPQVAKVSAPPAPGNIMKAVTPPTLTDAQSAELAAGSAAHSPTSLSFDVNGGSFYFVPNEIHVKKGDTITVNFKNDGGMHDFMLDEFNVKISPIKGGESSSATFVVDKTGTFEYYCSVGSHRKMGQRGTLIVE